MNLDEVSDDEVVITKKDGTKLIIKLPEDVVDLDKSCEDEREIFEEFKKHVEDFRWPDVLTFTIDFCAANPPIDSGACASFYFELEEGEEGFFYEYECWFVEQIYGIDIYNMGIECSSENCFEIKRDGALGTKVFACHKEFIEEFERLTGIKWDGTYANPDDSGIDGLGSNQ